MKRSRRHDSPAPPRDSVRQNRNPADKKKKNEAEVPAAKHIKETEEKMETEVPAPKAIKETTVEEKVEAKAPAVNDTNETAVEEKTE